MKKARDVGRERRNEMGIKIMKEAKKLTEQDFQVFRKFISDGNC